MWHRRAERKILIKLIRKFGTETRKGMSHNLRASLVPIHQRFRTSIPLICVLKVKLRWHLRQSAFGPISLIAIEEI